MHDRDCLHRFLFEQYPFRGHLVHLDAAWRALIEHREYPAAIRDALGEAVAASLLLAATIKFEGVLSLQLQGDGPVHLLLAQCTSGLGVRGLARYREGFTGDGAGIADLTGAGNLTVTLETDEGSQRYQGIVPISGDRLAQSLQVYFENSEQLPTRLWLHADEHGASGMLLQRLPAAGGGTGVGTGGGVMDPSPAAGAGAGGGARSTGPGPAGTPGAGIAAAVGASLAGALADAAAVDDAWRRVQLIGETLTAGEMRSLSDAEILRRLFNEDDVRLFEPSPVFFRCRCSRERVAGMLQGLGETETRSVLAERGEVEVRCDFCNRAYVFDAVDVAQLFNAGVAGGSGGSVH